MIRDFTSIRLQMIVSSAARHSSTRIVGFERETISTTIDLIVAVATDINAKRFGLAANSGLAWLVRYLLGTKCKNFWILRRT